MKLTIEKLQTLPQEIQQHIKDTLKAYDEVTVVFENGQYTLGTCIKATYANYHEVLGTIHASDIYTKFEIIENYINEFCEYPIQYEGKRDYKVLRDMEASKIYNEDYTECKMLQGALINNEFVITGTKIIKI